MEQERTFCPEDGWDVKIDEEGLCVHCGATATGAAVDELYKELQRLKKLANPKHTFCPNDGWDVDIDDENCCTECGCLAVGEAVDKLHEDREELELLRKEKEAKEFDNVMNEIKTEVLTDSLGMKVSELCRKTHMQACNFCDDLSCDDNQNKEKK